MEYRELTDAQALRHIAQNDHMIDGDYLDAGKRLMKIAGRLDAVLSNYSKRKPAVMNWVDGGGQEHWEVTYGVDPVQECEGLARECHGRLIRVYEVKEVLKEDYQWTNLQQI